MDLFADRTFLIDTENAFKIGPHITKLESALESASPSTEVIKLNLGEPDFNIPEFVKSEINHQLELNNTHYCDPKGLLSLRTAIANQVSATRGIQVTPDRVVVFPGAKPGIGFSQQVYCNPNDEVIYPTPGFPIYESFTRYLGLKPVPLTLHESMDFTFTAEELKRLISPRTKLIFLNFPSNPTGGVATQKQLEEIAEVILSKCHKNVRIYSDEIYENIIYDGHKHHSIASIPEMDKRTIISSGFSKSYAWTGGRVGYCVFPTVEEADIFKNMNINYFSCVPPYNQEAARSALEHEASKKAVSEMVRTFEARRKIIVDGLNAIPGVHCTLPKGAFYVFPNVEKVCHSLGVIEAYKRLKLDAKLDPKLDSELRESKLSGHKLAERIAPTTLLQMFVLYSHRVAVLDRRSFGKIGSQNQHFIRLSFAADAKKIEEGLRRLKIAFEDTEGFKLFMNERLDVF